MFVSVNWWLNRSLFPVSSSATEAARRAHWFIFVKRWAHRVRFSAESSALSTGGSVSDKRWYGNSKSKISAPFQFDGFKWIRAWRMSHLVWKYSRLSPWRPPPSPFGRYLGQPIPGYSQTRPWGICKRMAVSRFDGKKSKVHRTQNPRGPLR